MGLRKGLVYIWASATAAMVFLYFIWPLVVYVMAVADWVFEVLKGSGVPIADSWVNLYYEWKPRFRDVIGYTSLASFISLLIYIIVNSARREPDYSPEY